MPDGGDAARGGRIGLVPDQPVVGVGLVQVVQDRGPLEPFQILVSRQPIQVVLGLWWVGHWLTSSRYPR